MQFLSRLPVSVKFLGLPRAVLGSVNDCGSIFFLFGLQLWYGPCYPKRHGD